MRSLFLVVTTLPALLQLPGPALAEQIPALESLRADEDWSLLRDPRLRTDTWRRLKYIPLTEHGSYLSLGGDLRERYEGYLNEGFGTGVADSNGYHQHRLFLHADLHAGSRVRFFGQIKTSEQICRPGPARGNDVDHLDLHQGFVELRASDRFSLRAGRQELLFGSTRL